MTENNELRAGEITENWMRDAKVEQVIANFDDFLEVDWSAVVG